MDNAGFSSSADWNAVNAIAPSIDIPRLPLPSLELKS
jgi:hypothetical protein